MIEVFVDDAKDLHDLALGKKEYVTGHTQDGRFVKITPKTVYIPGLSDLFNTDHEVAERG